MDPTVYLAPKRLLPNRDGQGDEPHPVVPGLNEHQDVVLAILLCSIDRVLDIGRSANPVIRSLKNDVSGR